jgi:hypothetical protein
VLTGEETLKVWTRIPKFKGHVLRRTFEHDVKALRRRLTVSEDMQIIYFFIDNLPELSNF